MLMKPMITHSYGTIYWSILFSLLFVSGGCSQDDISSVVVHTDDGELQFSIEIADTDSERSQGLMNRSSLASGSGMLFVFGKEVTPAFWMKNTFIPLDIIFIGAGTVLDVKKGLPCRVDPCPLITTDAPAQYVLEVNEGGADSIHRGDAVELR